MMVLAMTVPFFSSMVTDSWLSFWRNPTASFAAPFPLLFLLWLDYLWITSSGSTSAAMSGGEVAPVESTNDPCVSARC